MKNINVKINGHSNKIPENKVMPFLFEVLLDNPLYMSDEAISKHLSNIFDLVDEAIKTKTNQKKTNSGRKIIIDCDRNKMLTYVYNTILASEGMGFLPGKWIK